MFNNSFFENHAVYELKVKIYCTDGQATGDHIIRRKRIQCWIPKGTNTHSENAFHCSNGCVKRPQCCITRTMPCFINKMVYVYWAVRIES
jgi:hypothetical protein